jgi:uncharacterized protein (TIGR03032 family)
LNTARNTAVVGPHPCAAYTPDASDCLEPDGPTTSCPPEVRYSFSEGLMDRLAALNTTLAFTSYQSGFLYLVGSHAEHGPQLHQSVLAKPMGLALCDDGGLIVASEGAIIRYRDVLRSGEQINQIFDACYMPRTLHMTGELDAHDIGVDSDGQLIFVNTRFNCLATTSDVHSFSPVWWPSFISSLVDEDRCHLNGLAFDGGRAAYVTAVSQCDTLNGWRDRRHDGGIVIDVENGEIICAGLSMPHSPRVHEGRLWILNSGTGELGTVGEGRFVPHAFCPGFARGLAFHGNLAFVGLSKPRYERFEGLVLDDRLREAGQEAWCGIQIIDLDTGACIDWFRIESEQVTELYDLAIIRGHRCAMAASPTSFDATRLITIDQPQAFQFNRGTK